MKVTRYVRKTTLDALRARAGGAFLGGPFNRDPVREINIPITIIIPDPPIKVTVWAANNGDGCRCVAPRGECGNDKNCTKYTGPLNPVTP